jgi:hypothetical protein
MGNNGKFELVALDKAQVVHEVNAVGGEIAEYRNASLLNKAEYVSGAFMFGLIETKGKMRLNIAEEALKLGLDSHEGRKEFLSKKLGVDASTSDDYRFVTYTNDAGQMTYFKGHMEGDKKLVLTDSLAAPENPEQVHSFVQSSFKPLPKPIEIQIEKSTAGAAGTKLEISPDEQRKLETQTTLASAMQKSGDVQLASNARLPGKQPGKGAGLNA